MRFTTIRVWYKYPSDPDTRLFHKDYTVPDNEPFPHDHAWKQWQRDHTIPHNLVAYHSAGTTVQEQLAPIVQLPLGFCETKYPGYFWNANERKMYSLKSGVLKEIKRRKWNGNKQYGPTDGYNLSHLGKRRHISHEDALKLVPMRAVIPTEPVRKKLGSRW